MAILVVLASRDVAMAPAARQSANQFGAIVETQQEGSAYLFVPSVALTPPVCVQFSLHQA